MDESAIVRDCWDHVRVDPDHVDLYPGLGEAELKRLDTAANENEEGGWMAVGKADLDGSTIEFYCEMSKDLKVTSSQVGPEGTWSG